MDEKKATPKAAHETQNYDSNSHTLLKPKSQISSKKLHTT